MNLEVVLTQTMLHVGDTLKSSLRDTEFVLSEWLLYIKYSVHCRLTWCVLFFVLFAFYYACVRVLECVCLFVVVCVFSSVCVMFYFVLVCGLLLFKLCCKCYCYSDCMRVCVLLFRVLYCIFRHTIQTYDSDIQLCVSECLTVICEKFFREWVHMSAGDLTWAMLWLRFVKLDTYVSTHVKCCTSLIAKG